MSSDPGTSRWARRCYYGLGSALLIFTVYVSATIPWHPTIHRGLFLLAIIALGVLGRPLPPKFRVVDAAILACAAMSIGYLTWNWEELAYRANFEPVLHEYVFAFMAIAVVLEITRRTVGLPLALVAIAAILYARFGAVFPEPLTHKGYSVGRLVVSQYLTHEGLFGSLLGVASTLVAAFVLFGCLAQHVGVADFFMKLSAKFTFGAFGGPGKLEVISSALFGTISGSSTANVVATGTTIPLMIKAGFRPAFAAAVEAVSSTGGQIMPPVMGVAAFLMAEVTGIPYATIALAAVIPAVLYYICVYIEVDLEARRLRLQNISVEGAKLSLREVVSQIHLLVPLVVLIYLLFYVYSPTKAAFWACVAAVAAGLPAWRSLMEPSRLRVLVKDFCNACVTVGMACASSGIVVGVLNLTGMSMQLSYGLVDLAGNNSILLMVFVMFLCFILGMGLPTPAAYAVAAAFAAPMLTTTGMTRLSAHLFVLYYACLSSITPPVAIAAFAAAGIAGAPAMRTGWIACKLGLSAFIVPFMFAHTNALFLGQDTWLNLTLASGTALIGVAALSVATIGYLCRPITRLEQLAYFVVAVLLIHPSLTLSVIGIGVGGVLVAFHLLAHPRGAAIARTPST
jgi:TRAP transporter 4TM/12TM fusion protein